MPLQIDKVTHRAAINRFEKLYGKVEDLGLSKRDCAKLLKHGVVPRWILKKNMNEAKELGAVADEYKNILVKVMKLRRTL